MSDHTGDDIFRCLVYTAWVYLGIAGYYHERDNDVLPSFFFCFSFFPSVYLQTTNLPPWKQMWLCVVLLSMDIYRMTLKNKTIYSDLGSWMFEAHAAHCEFDSSWQPSLHVIPVFIQISCQPLDLLLSNK